MLQSVPRTAVVLAATAVLAATVPAPAAADPAVAIPDGGGAPTPTEAFAGKAAPAVQQALAAGGEADLLVALADRADLSGASDLSDWGERGAYVVRRLQETAAASQRGVRSLLDRAGADYQAFWIANTILVRDASHRLAQQLAAVPAVAGLHEPAEHEVPDLTPTQSTTQAEAVEWGIDAIRADAVWDELGVRGEGILVANIDTGVQYDHPDLVDRYAGRTADGDFDHDYHWFDPARICGGPTAPPCDNQGHGTHTMGTMVGGSASGTAIGVAPQARWIAAKGCEATTDVACSPQALLSAGQWTLAPTDRAGQNPRPELRPHIVNNSWGAPTGPFTDPWYDQIIAAWNAAGMFALFSNGNSGSQGCASTGSPADSPDTYAVGAHDIEGQIASFSSRGPGFEGQIRPHLAAPGVEVRSSIPDDRYTLGNGTSMAAPHLAGTVALMWAAAPTLVGDISGTRELLGQSAVDTEDLSCGGTPENNNVYGQGRLDAHAAVTASPIGPTGTLAGRVTDAATGEPVPGATVHAAAPEYQRTTTTDPDGRYSMTVVAAEYAVTGSAFGYETATVDGVVVAADETTTQDLGLVALPSVTVGGTVTDGSGQGWPLYAGIRVHGYPHGTIYTDPLTGRFEVVLPAGDTYTLDVEAQYPGYDPATRQVVVGAEDTTVDIPLAASIDECAAAGYQPAHHGLFEEFESGAAPPGWELSHEIGDGWEFDDPAGRDNRTGAEGLFASIDGTSGARREDGRLTSPPVDLTGLAEPVLSWRNHLLLTRGLAEVELSLDGGASWEQVWEATRSVRESLEQVPLPQAADRAGVRVRFHFRNDISSNGLWQLDRLLIGERFCQPIPGGLVVGHVRDDRTQAALNQATVTLAGHPEAATSTVDTPDDQNRDGGFYWLFAPGDGEQQLTAAHPVGQYAPASATAAVAAGGVAQVDLALGSGELRVSAAELPTTLELGEAGTAMLTIRNVGTAPASFQLAERAGADGPTATQQRLLDRPGAPLQREPVPVGAALGPIPDPDPVPAPTPEPAAAPEAVDPGEAEWVQRHDSVTNWTNTLGAVYDGKLYVIGGSSGVAQRNQIYDIAEDRWTLSGNLMSKRSSPAGGFIGDRLYVVGGQGPPGRGLMDTTLIHDPVADTWTEGAPAPRTLFAPGHAILADQLYVIGGQTENPDDPDGDLITTAAAQVYDPAADRWSPIADYPEPASWQMCGPIDGLIYCAGGAGPAANFLDRGYVYHPDTDRWYRIPDLPQPMALSGYTAAGGLLLLSGGRVGGHRSNQGFYYDPGRAAWSELPNALWPLERLASACGFFKVGGFRNPAIGSVTWMEELPGFDDCDRTGGDRVPWLATEVAASGRSGSGARDQAAKPGVTASATVPPGESVTVTVTVDSAAGIDQPGAYLAALAVLEDAPGDLPPVRVPLTVTPPPTWGEVAGTVAGLDRCDEGPPAPLAGARVQIRDRIPGQLLGEVVTDSAGRFSYWLDVGAQRGIRPVTVTAAHHGWVTRDRPVPARAGRTTRTQLVLPRDEPCATADPDQLAVSVPAGGSEPVELTLGNLAGAAGFDYRVATTEQSLEPLPPIGPAAAGEWTEAAEVPRGLSLYGFAQCPEQPDYGYLAGGVENAGDLNPKLRRYDAAADRWQELASPPAPPGRSPAMVCEAGRLHVIGGDQSGAHYVYDVARDRWQAAAPLPTPRSEAAAGIWNGQVYLAGGAADGGFFETLDRVDVYDPATDRWRAGNPAPVATRSPGYVQAGPYLYLAGGFDRTADPELRSAVQRLDLRDGSWSTGPALAEPRGALALAATDQALYALGGYAEFPFGTIPSDTVQRLTWSDWDGGGSWQLAAVPALPANRANGPAGFCTEGRAGGEIWSVGGAGGTHLAAYLPLPGERCAALDLAVPWLDVPTPTGTVPAGESTALTVTVDAADLTRGETYQATILVITTDPGAPQLRIPLTVQVR